MELSFSVVDQVLNRLDSTTVVAKSKNFLTAKFEFNSVWNDLVKTAQFSNGVTVVNRVLVDNKCVVPWEVLQNDGNVSITLFGGDRLTTKTVRLKVEKCDLQDVTEPAEETPSAYDQLAELVATIQAKQEATDARLNELIASLNTGGGVDG